MALKKETIRGIVLFGATTIVLGAYVMHRRSAIQASGTGGSQDMGQAAQNSQGPGPDGGDGQGPGEDRGGPGREGGSDGTDHGVEPGMADPQGRPGEDGPRSHSLCIKKTAPGNHHFQLSGKITFTDQDPTKKRAVTTILAVDTPIADWEKTDTIRVYESLFLTSDRWQLDFKAPKPNVHVCAVQTSDYQEFTYVHVAGCSPTSPTARPGGAPAVEPDMTVEVKKLATTAEFIGFTKLVPRHVWPGTTTRRISGQAVMPSQPGARFLIATAQIPILEQAEDSEGNPNGLYVTGPDGRFDITLLAEPNESQFVCAMAFPPKGTAIKQLDTLAGSGCVKVQVPPGGPSVQLPNVRVQVHSKAIEMTTHEREHFTFLDACLSD